MSCEQRLDYCSEATGECCRSVFALFCPSINPRKKMSRNEVEGFFRAVKPDSSFDNIDVYRKITAISRQPLSRSSGQNNQTANEINKDKSRSSQRRHLLDDAESQELDIEAPNVALTNNTDITNHSRPRVRVVVQNGDLLNAAVDAIVVSTNRELDSTGGAAKHVADAAGPALIDECRKYISKNGKLHGAEVMHTSAGNIKPPVKYVIHTVVQRENMQATFERCFMYANKLRLRSVALPAIGSGLIGIDKQSVAKAAEKALKSFESYLDGLTTERHYLQEIQFVNIDSKATDALRSVFSSRLQSASDDLQQPKKTTGRRERELKEDLTDKTQLEQNTNKDVENDKDTGKLNATNSHNCVICLSKITDKKMLPCGHKFCSFCIDACFTQHQPKCPTCGEIFGALNGNQPDGTMTYRTTEYSLPGFEDCNTIEINYNIPDGIQGDNHPNPGVAYHGTKRTAYLPDNTEGNEILQLLRTAFDAKLIFTVGRSNTTGKENVVIWNDIHHKTSPRGQFGYPDEGYFNRVKDELSAKGITSQENAEAKLRIVAAKVETTF